MSQKYEEPYFSSKQETVRILNGSSAIEQKVNAIVGAINHLNDPVWLQELCLNFINHPDKWVAGAAINGLGDIARNFGLPNVDLVVKRLIGLKSDRADLIGKIEDAIDDINTFIK